MQNRIVVAAGAVLVLVGVAGCSSSPQNTPQPAGSLPPATAQVTINGKNAGTTKVVACTQDDWLHTIVTGDKVTAMQPDAKPGAMNNASGVQVVIDTKQGKGLDAKSVQITDINGFTGSVWENEIGDARATMIGTGTTFKITGSAQDASNKDITVPFEIKANC
jgi:ipoprotein LpqH